MKPASPHAPLLRALALAQALLQAAAARAQALADLGDIDLPDSRPTAEDARQIADAGALYLAHELDRAGLLRTAELVAGLFASGAIHQPLGPTAALIEAFWRGRHQRMSAEERSQLLEPVFDADGFYPLMQALCDALVVLPERPPESDLRARIAVQQCAEALGGWLAQRGGAMLGYAAEDVVSALSQATRFLRDRLLQAAFGARDLWALVGVVNQAQGSDAATVRLRVELGREGAAVLGWLAGTLARPAGPEGSGAPGPEVMAAAESWRSAWARLQLAASRAAGPARPAVSFSTTVAGGTGWL